MEFYNKEEVDHATHNHVPLGNRGVTLQRAQLLAPEDLSNYHQRACTTGIPLLYAVVRKENV